MGSTFLSLGPLPALLSVATSTPSASGVISGMEGFFILVGEPSALSVVWSTLETSAGELFEDLVGLEDRFLDVTGFGDNMHFSSLFSPDFFFTAGEKLEEGFPLTLSVAEGMTRRRRRTTGSCFSIAGTSGATARFLSSFPCLLVVLAFSAALEISLAGVQKSSSV